MRLMQSFRMRIKNRNTIDSDTRHLSKVDKVATAVDLAPILVTSEIYSEVFSAVDLADSVRHVKAVMRQCVARTLWLA